MHVRRADLSDFSTMLMEAPERIAYLKAVGLPREGVIEAKPMALFNPKYYPGFIPAELFVSLVYGGV